MTDYLLNIDWLSVNYFRSEHTNFAAQLPEGWKVEKMPYTTRQFAEVHILKFNEGECCTIVSRPFSSIISPLLVQVKLANTCFYNGFGIAVLQFCEQFFSLNYQSISRIDICVDTARFDMQMFARDFRSGKVRQTGKRQVQEWYVMDWKRGGIEYNGVKFGNVQSAYTFKIYDKSKEIREESLKYYIVDWWKTNQLRESGRVWRMEFSISDLDKFCTKEGEVFVHHTYMHSMEAKMTLLKLYAKKCRFYYHGTGSKPCRCKTYELFPFDSLPDAQIIKNCEIGNKQRTAKILINMQVQRLIDLHISKLTTSQSFAILQSIKELSHAYTLDRWLHDKWGDDLHKVEKELYAYELHVVRKKQIDIFGNEYKYIEQL